MTTSHQSAAADAPSSTLWQELRSLPRPYWILFLGIFINRIGTFVYPFLTITLTRRGFENWQIGLALGGYGIGGLVSTLVGGWFADRFGRKNTIIVGTAMNAASVLAMAWAGSVTSLLPLTVLAGFSVGFFGPAASALVADVVPARLHVRAYAGSRLAANAGFAVGTFLGGLLVNRAPLMLFLGDAATTFAYGLLAVFFLPKGVTASRTEARWSEAWSTMRGNAAFWALLGAQVCVTLVFAQFSTTYSKEILQSHLQVEWLGWRPTAETIFGLLVGWNGLMIVLLEMVLTRFTQRFEPRAVMSLGHALLGIGFGLNAFCQTFAGFFGAMTLFTLGEMLASPLMSAALANLAPEKMRGRYLGALSATWSLGTFIGPQVGFAIYGMNPRLLWFGCAALGLTAAVVQWRGLSRLKSGRAAC